MAEKRRALTVLTHDNWDREDDDDADDGAGNDQSMVMASADELKKRKIAKAKRSVNDSERQSLASSTSFGSSPFTNFKGFANTDTKTPLTPLTSLKSSTSSLTSPFASQFNKFVSSAPSTLTAAAVTNTTQSAPVEDGINGHDTDDVRSDEYFSRLSKLNKSFFEWVNAHMTKSPFYDFTPVCNDYIQFIKDLHRKFPKLESRGVTDSGICTQLSVPSTPLLVTEKVPEKSVDTPMIAEEPPKPSSTQFKFTSVPVFSFGSVPTLSVTPPSDVNVNANDGQSQQTGDDDDYVPPQTERIEHEESDSVYNTRCKLYYLRDGKYTERGVGVLNMIKNAKMDSPQLLIRTDTKCGNILLNISMKDIPVSIAADQKGIIIACIPNPPINTKKESDRPETVTYLIRVKNAKDLYDSIKTNIGN